MSERPHAGTRVRAARQAQSTVLHHTEVASGKISATCRYYPISRQCYDVWPARDEECFNGLKVRSSNPRTSRLRSIRRSSRRSCGYGSNTT